MIYFDNASTTSVRTEVRRVYGQMLETCYGNPDSLHAAGRQASSLMEKSRSNIASMLHVDPSEIIFTSAASESNTLAIVGYALANEHRGHHVLTSNVEHSSVRHAMEFLKRFGFEVEFLPINEEGIVTPECLKSHMRKDTILVSVMHVNNEMGAINPILESTPFCSIIFVAIAIEALPEIGLNITNGTISFGNLIIFNTGDNNVVTNSIIPELFNNPIAKNNPINVGKIFNVISIPFIAPFINKSKIGFFSIIPTKTIIKIIIGIDIIEI